MFKKIVFTVLFILVSFFGTAQKDINNYKYIIVPKAYDFSKTEDLYQLNSLTKFLFNKYGYEAYFPEDDFPEDLKTNSCLALTVAVSKEKGGLLKTQLILKLKDCFSAIVMTSQVGESRLKEFNKAYNEALRGAFETFQNLNYKYVPKEAEVAIVEKTPIILLDNNVAEVASNAELIENKQGAVNQFDVAVYYAQAITNGFQLVNSEPKIVMILWTTAAENVFIVKGKSAIVFKEDGFWYYSENDGKLGKKQTLNIKF
jgi:hypothetical protein